MESPTLRRTTAAGVQVSPGPALQNLHRGREKLLEITVWRWQGPPLPHLTPPGVHLLCEQCLLPRGLLKARATSMPSLSGSRFKRTSANHLSFPSKQTGFMLEVSSKQSFPTQILSSWGQKCNKTERLSASEAREGNASCFVRGPSAGGKAGRSKLSCACAFRQEEGRQYHMEL